MRLILDRFYQLCAVLSALCLLSICLLVISQIQGRFTGWSIPSSNEMAGYMVLAATFLALAPSFRLGAHIRVKLVIERLPASLQRLFEYTSLLLAIALVGYAAWWCIELVRESLEYGDVSTGRLRIPLAVPQSAMVAGLLALLVALIDCLIALTRGQTLPYDQALGLMDEQE